MRNNLKQKIMNKELTIGSWLQIPSTVSAEIMAKSGFDWLVVDMEHSAIDIDQTFHLIQTIDLAGCVPLVRLSENNATLIKRVMDAGSHGIIVPNVNSVEDAQKAVEAAKYPPEGKRGVGLFRAQGYGFDFEKYVDWQKNNSIVIVQIEHIDAVNNLTSILAVKGVDGFIVGPYDLSASMGIPGKFEHPDFKQAFEKILKTAKQINALMGTHVVMPDVAEAKKRIEQGYRFIAFSIDTLFLGSACKQDLKLIRE